MKRAITVAACVLAACATSDFKPVAPQPAGFEKSNPCNEIEPAARVQPAYPEDARDAGQPGWVAVQYDVTIEGVVANASIFASSPEGLFDAAALAAVNQWRYPPQDAAVSGCHLLLTFRPPDA
jgi:periplasmic protein TonB